MPRITLPDGSIKEFDAAVTVADVAASIGPGLAKAALAGRVDGQAVDTSYLIEADAALEIITGRDDAGLEVIRHSTAHLMAQAVQRLYPEAQVTIGPVIEHGFFYDFAYEPGFSPEDLGAIEAEMTKIVGEALEVTRSVMTRDEAVTFFREKGEEYKARIIEDIPADEILSLYSQGEFIDLCRGPHVPNTRHLSTFKLTKLAGAYWRGDSQNEMLQRIYGTAWSNKKELKAYLHRLEEAEKRDHRKLGKQMSLFHFQEEAPGAIFWHPRGWTLFRQLIEYMRIRQQAAGYTEISTPNVMDAGLWEASGHMEKFGENMYTTRTPDDRLFALKPMNCPGGVQVFKQGLRSYRELPLRIAEFGKVNRYEPSGALHGLMRVREFTQDDAHIYCTREQVTEECVTVCELIVSIYRDFGFDEIKIKFSDRPEKRVGSDEIWDESEAALMAAVESMGLEYDLNPGEGAFYGPKLEFVLRDAIGRDWQCGTLQVDLNMPARLGAFYVGEDGEKHEPVMLHRALFGSLERFTGILIEHYAGALPPWLAPVQAVVMNITDAQADYCRKVTEGLLKQGFRVESDLRNEKIGFKIREHTLQKVPYLLVVGDREAEAGAVAVRLRKGKDLGAMSVEAFAQHLAADVENLSEQSV